MNALSEAAIASACLVALAAACVDARTGRIPNLLTLPALLLGVVLATVEGGASGVVSSALGVFACACVPAFLFWSSKGAAIGGGDVKLFAALGALLGPSAGLEVELASLVLLAVFALVVLTARGRLFGMLRRSFWISVNWALPKERRRNLEPESMVSMRMGPAICLATWGFAVLEYLPSFLV